MEPGVYGWTEVKDLDAMTVAELKEYASENGIALTGLTLKGGYFSGDQDRPRG